VQRARQQQSEQAFLSLAVAPPHLQLPDAAERRSQYEAQLLEAGADAVIPCTTAVLTALEQALDGQSSAPTH
jgi:HAD superfamily phosphatase